MIKQCIICGNSYEAKRKDQRYCSKACSKEGKFIHKTCTVCGNDFKSIHKETQTCSKKCLAETLRAGVDKRCSECGKPIYVKQCHNKEHNFCSIKCQAVFFGKTRDTREITTCTCCGKEFKETYNGQKYCSYDCAHEAREDTVDVKCVICGNNFTVRRYRKHSAKICSKECYSKYFGSVFDKHKGKRIRNLRYKWKHDDNFRERMTEKNRELFTGENHPSYNHSLTTSERITKRAYTEYSYWRTKVYEKDDYTCKCCGKVGGRLNAHHMYNYSDYPKLRTEVSNGITLCYNCHTAFHQIYGKHKNTKEQLIEYIRLNKLA